MFAGKSPEHFGVTFKRPGNEGGVSSARLGSHLYAKHNYDDAMHEGIGKSSNMFCKTVDHTIEAASSNTDITLANVTPGKKVEAELGPKRHEMLSG